MDQNAVYVVFVFGILFLGYLGVVALLGTVSLLIFLLMQNIFRRKFHQKRAILRGYLLPLFLFPFAVIAWFVSSVLTGPESSAIRIWGVIGMGLFGIQIGYIIFVGMRSERQEH